MTRADRVISFVERYLLIPEGAQVGRPIRLLPFQKEFIRDVYDNPAGTKRAYLSIGRKNGKSALIACLGLTHIIGPEAVQNSQIVSGARSRKQAALVFKLMVKMLRLSPQLSKLVHITDSGNYIRGLAKNVEYSAVSAEAGTAHGLSPVLAILDEVGQIKGPYDAFVEAIETAQGAYENPLLIAISTQAATDGDLFSVWLDDAKKSGDPRIVSHLHAAPADCDLMDRGAWRAANPAMGVFRSDADLEQMATMAVRLPAQENSFRWLFLNQRISGEAPFVSEGVWKACGGPVADRFEGPVYCGLDLSATSDLTAFVALSPVDGIWHAKSTFWLPGAGLREKSETDRVPYDVWHRQGFLQAAPGRTVDYSFVAQFLREFCAENDVRKIAFDRYNMKFLRPELARAGFSDADLEDGVLFEPFGQGMVSMSPALRDLEAHLLNGRIAHGMHPVLEMCARNALVIQDAAGNRKFDKRFKTRRIDGMVALAMAMSVAGTWQDNTENEANMDSFFASLGVA